MSDVHRLSLEDIANLSETVSKNLEGADTATDDLENGVDMEMTDSFTCDTFKQVDGSCECAVWVGRSGLTGGLAKGEGAPVPKGPQNLRKKSIKGRSDREWAVKLDRCIDASPFLLSFRDESTGGAELIYVGSHGGQVLCVTDDSEIVWRSSLGVV